MPNSFDYDNIERKIAIVEADMESACVQHGIRGHLQHKSIEQMIAEISVDERQARVHGKFAHLVGLVFKQWNKRVHVIPPFEIKDLEYVTYHSLDTHLNTPYAGLWVATNAYGRKYVVDELWKNATESELALMVAQKNEKYRMGRQWIEPAADISEQAVGGTSLRLRLQQKHNLHYELGSKERTACIQRIQNALDYVEVGGVIEKFPELYVFSTCERLIWELDRYVYDEWKGKTKESRNPKDKPVDKDDHLIESLGRILFEEPSFYVAPPKEIVEQVQNIAENQDPFA